METVSSERALPQYPIESVDRALRLLLMFRETRELRLADARRALDVGQSTAHRLLSMLVYHRFVDQDPVSRRYKAGPALVEIGLSVVGQMDLRAVARPILEDLAERTGETAHLGVLEDGQVRFVDGVESGLALRVVSRVGRLLPAHATSLGKAMLAELPLSTLRTWYPNEVLPSVTPKTKTRRSELFAELEWVSDRGYAVNSEESEVGVSSLGVAVTRPQGGVIAGMSIAAPSVRMSDEQRVRYAKLLTDACVTLSTQMSR